MSHEIENKKQKLHKQPHGNSEVEKYDTGDKTFNRGAQWQVFHWLENSQNFRTDGQILPSKEQRMKTVNRASEKGVTRLGTATYTRETLPLIREGSPVRLTADFASETMDTRRQWHQKTRPSG